jgi:hypothetical protein
MYVCMYDARDVHARGGSKVLLPDARLLGLGSQEVWGEIHPGLARALWPEA